MKNQTTMLEMVDSFLDYRKQLRFSTREEGRCLRQFARFADERASGAPLSEALILEWAGAGKPEASPYRLEAFRNFVPWLVLHDERVIAPRAELMRERRHARTAPYIYEPEEVKALFDAIWSTGSVSWGEWPRFSHDVAMGLLESTGIRVAEASNLDDDDVDLGNGHLHVRNSKNLPLRLVPLDVTVVAGLRRYRERRQRYCPRPQSRAFILSYKGRRLTPHAMQVFFQHVRKAAGVPFRPHRRDPRLYDFRHTFASHHLLQAYRENRDIDVAIANLSVYLGHKNIANTYWYLTALPELRALCAERFRRYAEEIRREGHQ